MAPLIASVGVSVNAAEPPGRLLQAGAGRRPTRTAVRPPKHAPFIESANAAWTKSRA